MTTAYEVISNYEREDRFLWTVMYDNPIGVDSRENRTSIIRKYKQVFQSFFQKGKEICSMVAGGEIRSRDFVCVCA